LIELLVVIAIIAILVAMLSFYGNATNVLFCPSAGQRSGRAGGESSRHV
jgi:hypothetical protein